MLRDMTYSDPKEALPELEMSLFVRPLFRPGEGYITPGAQAALKAINVSSVLPLSLHPTGNWGEVSEEDTQANERATAAGSGRIISVQVVRGVRFRVVTDQEHNKTIIRHHRE